MADTPRRHRFQLPMATRSTDVGTLQDCPGRWVLTHLRQPEQAAASFFILGTALHSAIENAIVFDMDLDWALAGMRENIDRELELAASAPRRIESSKRGFDSMHADAERMLRQWFTTVHPDSEDRLDLYSEYQWPPRTEVEWSRHDATKYPAWGSSDAVFLSHDAETVAVVDWKSGTSRQRTDDQLHYYMYGLGHNGIQKMVGWFHHLDRVQKRSIIQEVSPYPGDKHVRQRILMAEGIKDQIIEGKYPTFSPSALCNWCPVQHLCPADGDVRMREQNAEKLRRMLRLAKGMVQLPEQDEREVA